MFFQQDRKSCMQLSHAKLRTCLENFYSFTSQLNIEKKSLIKKFINFQ